MALKEKRNETLVGAFLLVGSVMLGILVMQFGRLGDLLRGSYEISVVFQQASGVIKGSSVQLGGTKIGEVSEAPRLTEENKALVVLSIDEDVLLPEDSAFQIATAGFLGDKMIVVTPPEKRGEVFLEPGVTLEGGGASGLELIQNEAETIAGDAKILMKDARTAMIKLDSSLDDIRAVAVRLADSIETINNEVLSEKNVANLSSTLENFNKTSQALATLPADLKPLLARADETLTEVKGAATSAEKTFATAESEIARLQPTLDALPKTVKAIETTATEASSTLADLREGEGLLGTLTKNKEVKADAETFIGNLRRYGILGYRDAEISDENDPRNRFRGRRR